MSLLPYAAMATTWRALVAMADELDDGVERFVPERTHRDAAYHRRWLPFAASDDLTLFVDLAPGPTGAMGQVLFPVDEHRYRVVAPSLSRFLERWLQLLDDGRVRFDPQLGYATPVGDTPLEELLVPAV